MTKLLKMVGKELFLVYIFFVTNITVIILKYINDMLRLHNNIFKWCENCDNFTNYYIPHSNYYNFICRIP